MGWVGEFSQIASFARSSVGERQTSSMSFSVSVRSVTYLCERRSAHAPLSQVIALLLLLELILKVVAQLLYLTFGIRRTRHLSAIKPKSKREGLS